MVLDTTPKLSLPDMAMAVSAGSLLSTWKVVMSVLVAVYLRAPGVEGHGRLLDPPSRSTMWRVGFNTPHNYDDNQLFCGGVAVQYDQNGGKCGVCGDPWQGPRDNEPGGKYATGIITRKYSEGQVIEVNIQLTANHMGWFEFRLCQHNSPFKNITHECLDQHLLVNDETGQTRYKVTGPAGYSVQQDIKIKLRLPRGVTCSACVLQWKYNAGNSWGTDPKTGQGCIGCGNQEQFYGCADVAIGRDDINVGVIPERFPWNIQEPDSEWHYGIAYVFGDTGSINSGGRVVCSLWGVLCSVVLLFIQVRSA